MKPQQLYEALIDLAEKLNITVMEKSFRNVGIKVRSGHCTVERQELYIMNKHLNIHKKNRLLAKFLATLDIENIYMMPAVREYLANVVVTQKIEFSSERETQETG